MSMHVWCQNIQKKLTLWHVNPGKWELVRRWPPTVNQAHVPVVQVEQTLQLFGGQQPWPQLCVDLMKADYRRGGRSLKVRGERVETDKGYCSPRPDLTPTWHPYYSVSFAKEFGFENCKSHLFWCTVQLLSKQTIVVRLTYCYALCFYFIDKFW